MRDYAAVLTAFKAEGLLPDDSTVISTHNNLVVASATEKVVFRIARISSIEQRVDPGDIRYSHHVAWLLGERASVLRPIEEKPRQYGDFVFSIYPLMTAVDWQAQRPSTLVQAVVGLGQALHMINGRVKLRCMNVEEYAQERLEFARTHGVDGGTLKWAVAMLEHYKVHHSFLGLTEFDTALVHGDLHAGNVVEDERGQVLFLDLDSIAVGPRLYDLASWQVRSELGDEAPLKQMVAQAQNLPSWSENQFRALVGWKLLSSVTHILRYAEPHEIPERLLMLDACGATLQAPGSWGDLIALGKVETSTEHSSTERCRCGRRD